MNQSLFRFFMTFRNHHAENKPAILSAAGSPSDPVNRHHAQARLGSALWKRLHKKLVWLVCALALSLHSVSGQTPGTTIYPAWIEGQVLFNNRNPEILAILSDPGREGMTHVRVNGTSSGASASTDSTEPSSTFLSKDFKLAVQVTVAGLDYRVASGIYLDGGREFYQTRSVEVGRILPFTTVPLDIMECAGLLEIRFVSDPVSHAPVTVDGGRIEAHLAGQTAQSLASFGASQFPPTNRLYLALRGGETCRVAITYQRGTDPFSNTVFRRHEETVTVPCDTIQFIEVEVPPETSLGRISGIVDMQGEFELPTLLGFEIRPDVANYGIYVETNLTIVSAVGGPFANYRYVSREGLPASGPYSLPNLLPSGETSPEQPYTVSASMQFDHRFTHGSPPIPAVTREFFVTPSRRVSVRAGENDLTNAFVINPGYLFGTVRAHGPEETPTGSPSLLRTFSGAHVYAYGMDEIAPGATFSAAGGLAYGSAPGSFDEASGQLISHYELAMGGLNGEASIWTQSSPYRTTVAFGFSTNSTNFPDYIKSSILVSDQRPGSFPVSPGSRHTNDLNYCFGQVVLHLRTVAGRLFDPRISAGGIGAATNGDYSVYINESAGTPINAASASNRAQVVTLLPEGTYTFDTQVQFLADDGALSTIYPARINGLELRCGEIIVMTPPCLSMALDSSRCFQTASGTVHGRVSTCTNNPVDIYYTFNGQTNFWGNTIGPIATFSIPLNLNGPCTDNTLRVWAVDESFDEASITTTLRYDNQAPTIQCPSNIVVECQSQLGTVVNYSVGAVDDCEPAPRLTCQPASGSLFPSGTTSVYCTAEDACGNERLCGFTVTVRDTTPPVLLCPTNIVVECSGTNGTVVTYPVTATDHCETNIPVACYPPSGMQFPVGETLVRCTAADSSGNFSECSFVVRVTPSRLTIERSVTVRWDCGVLQGADNINGPWTDIPGAANPYCVPSDRARRFYRTRN